MATQKEILKKRARLSAAKQALLEKRLQGKLKKKKGSQGIPRRSETGPAPLSYAQQRLWFFHQLEPESAAYHLYGATRLTGALHVAVLEQSINAIMQRHASLRTKFETIDEQPVQIIEPAFTFRLPLIDLCHLSKEEQEAEIQRLAYKEAQRPFDLSQCPLFRTVLLKLAEEEHLTITTIHHIIADDWSMGVFMLELVSIYAAFSQGKAVPLPELPIQYADFAEWQRQFLQGDVFERQLAYWK